MRHRERHRTHRTGWLRAAVLGANDGIVSTASLVLGVAAAGASSHGVMVAGVAGLVAGAMSMAAGEYVSVSSQADTERADLAREAAELAANPEQEHAELAGIYVRRGLDAALASSVAAQLMRHDALGAHGRDELGISDTLAARPVQAALASAATLRRGRRAAAADGSAVSGFDADVGRVGQLAGLSRAAGLAGCTGRGRTDDRVCCARRLLGRIGNGIDRRSGRAVRGRRLRSLRPAPGGVTPSGRSPACPG